MTIPRQRGTVSKDKRKFSAEKAFGLEKGLIVTLETNYGYFCTFQEGFVKLSKITNGECNAP